MSHKGTKTKPKETTSKIKSVVKSKESASTSRPKIVTKPKEKIKSIMKSKAEEKQKVNLRGPQKTNVGKVPPVHTEHSSSYVIHD